MVLFHLPFKKLLIKKLVAKCFLSVMEWSYFGKGSNLTSKVKGKVVVMVEGPPASID